MNLDEYFVTIGEGIRFLIALGSIIGLFGIITGTLILLLGSRSLRSKSFKLIFISLLLIITCGAYNGIKYFYVR